MIDTLVARADSCAVADLEDFHRDFLPRFIDAQRRYHSGDAEPNNALWSTRDPVSLFAARGLSGVGTADVTKTFRLVASWFSDLRSYEWELLVSNVSGDPDRHAAAVTVLERLVGGTLLAERVR